MTWKRSAIAIVFACVFVVGGFFFARQGAGLLDTRFEQAREKLKAKRDAGQLPSEWQEVDLDKLAMADVEMKVSGWDLWWASAGRWMSRWWFVWVPLVFAACLGIEWFEAWLVRRFK